ncbi:beta-lactamase family protein [Sandaracinobacter sp. RS1-74]|uniref:serine hydrolase domain-containing protein n=1 Tax=Sandaracinobacteroides sayramensis TaxID=2913411 RepID=UPI001EDAC7BE|nr:serine hydrolase domain-containing protein [Sandaracinobacteroides sayramensis]MCG2842548.1 beta-lactamase family protein [Sandaracinobacteroides sayramensis]
MPLNHERLTAIEGFLKSSYLEPARLPGTLVRVLHRGETVYSNVQGHADIASGRPLADDTIFRIYSMTKPITSIALMMLVEEGKLQLDDPVHRYIPSWKHLQVYEGGTLKTGWKTGAPARPMLVIDLLRHTAGLTYGFQLNGNVDAAYRQLGIGEIEKGDMTLERMIDLLADVPLEFSPGDWWNYSVATDVVGWLVQVIAGEPFEQFLERRIFRPLGMVDTGFHVREGQSHRLATCYQPNPKGGLDVQDQAETSSFLEAPNFISGGGGLVSTADDYLKFAEALRTGKPRLVGRKTLELMTANHLPGGKDLPQLSRSAFSEAAYEGVGFGLGFATTTGIHKTMVAGNNGDYFWGGAASTFFWVDPAEEMTVLFLTQLIPSSTWPVRRQLRTLVYSAVE